MENKNINILEILKSDKLIKENINFLAKEYLTNLNRKVCLSCPSDLRYMVLSLKNFYKMANFEFKRPFAQYKNKKGDKVTISNQTMTDEKAIEFLKTNPERIRLFSKVPSNWKALIEGEVETPEAKEKRLQIEAELAGVETPEAKEKRLLKEELLSMSLRDLREKYPEVRATSIAVFVELVLDK